MSWNLTPNQCIQLLRIYQMDKELKDEIALSVKELQFIKERVVLYWDSIDAKYKQDLVSTSLDEVSDLLRSNKRIFKEP